MYEVNRSAFRLLPLEPFWHWLNTLPDADLGGMTLGDLQQDANNYLVNPCDDADDVWGEIEARRWPPHPLPAPSPPPCR